MPKNYPANNVKIRRMEIVPFAVHHETGLHHAFAVEVDCVARGNGVRAPFVLETNYVGPGREAPWTRKQVFERFQSADNLNNIIANKFRDAFMNGIDEDPSV